jgi:phosphoribosyl-ATP pyrophosphohydrolase
MNVENFESPKDFKGDRLVFIFDKQRSLMDKYEKIEDSNGLLQTHDIPVDINTHKGQARLKDFFWRTTEEVAEALEAYDEENNLHVIEELADALHFLTEAAILSGIQASDILKGVEHNDTGDMLDDIVLENSPYRNINGYDLKEQLELKALMFIKSLGLAANCLKNKPWKQTQMLVDVNKYKHLFINAYHAFFSITWLMDMGASEVFDLYFRKSKVNDFRIDSKY